MRRIEEIVGCSLNHSVDNRILINVQLYKLLPGDVSLHIPSAIRPLLTQRVWGVCFEQCLHKNLKVMETEIRDKLTTE